MENKDNSNLESEDIKKIIKSKLKEKRFKIKLNKILTKPK
jgi:hypothetical protein